jgi:lysophospholipase L1-like esterase
LASLGLDENHARSSPGLCFSGVGRVATKVDSSVARLPATDDGLPGAGPLRRDDWFRDLWEGRHAVWTARGSRDHGAVVFLGDSITQEWGDDFGGAFPGVKVANRGISGDTTRGVLLRVPGVISLGPRAVVVLAGTNDLEDVADPGVVAGNMRLILDAILAGCPAAPIVLCEVFPSSASLGRPRERIASLNRLYAALAAARPRVTLVETWSVFAGENGDAKPDEFPDLLHPNKSGYDKWAAALRPVLARVLTDAAGPARP